MGKNRFMLNRVCEIASPRGMRALFLCGLLLAGCGSDSCPPESSVCTPVQRRVASPISKFRVDTTRELFRLVPHGAPEGHGEITLHMGDSLVIGGGGCVADESGAAWRYVDPDPGLPRAMVTVRGIVGFDEPRPLSDTLGLTLNVTGDNRNTGIVLGYSAMGLPDGGTQDAFLRPLTDPDATCPPASVAVMITHPITEVHTALSRVLHHDRKGDLDIESQGADANGFAVNPILHAQISACGGDTGVLSCPVETTCPAGSTPVCPAKSPVSCLSNAQLENELAGCLAGGADAASKTGCDGFLLRSFETERYRDPAPVPQSDPDAPALVHFGDVDQAFLRSRLISSLLLDIFNFVFNRHPMHYDNSCVRRLQGQPSSSVQGQDMSLPAGEQKFDCKVDDCDLDARMTSDIIGCVAWFAVNSGQDACGTLRGQSCAPDPANQCLEDRCFCQGSLVSILLKLRDLQNSMGDSTLSTWHQFLIVRHVVDTWEPVLNLAWEFGRFVLKRQTVSPSGDVLPSRAATCRQEPVRAARSDEAAAPENGNDPGEDETRISDLSRYCAIGRAFAKNGGGRLNGFAGHFNLGTATFTGRLRYMDHSAVSFKNGGWDDSDVNWMLHSRLHEGSTFDGMNKRDYIKIEHSGDSTIARFHAARSHMQNGGDDFWTGLDAIIQKDNAAWLDLEVNLPRNTVLFTDDRTIGYLQSRLPCTEPGTRHVFSVSAAGAEHDKDVPYDQVPASDGAAIGLMSLDCYHACYSELHPNWAMVLRVKKDNEARYAFYVVPASDEGYCSDSMWSAGFPTEARFFLAGPVLAAESQPITIDAVVSNGGTDATRITKIDSRLEGRGGGKTAVRITRLPGQGVMLSLLLPPSRTCDNVNDLPFIEGEVGFPGATLDECPAPFHGSIRPVFPVNHVDSDASGEEESEARHLTWRYLRFLGRMRRERPALYGRYQEEIAHDLSPEKRRVLMKGLDGERQAWDEKVRLVACPAFRSEPDFPLTDLCGEP